MIEPQRTSKGKKSRRYILNKTFQYKYSWYMITAVAGGSIFFLLPAFYFINQNYELFKSLAFDTQPALVGHLEREISWLRFFLFSSFALISGVTLFLSIKMTRNLLSPLVRMEKHIQQLMLGHWHIPDYHLPEEEDFKDLSITYDYFYRSLKANTEAELKMLEKLSIDPQNREAYAAWKKLLAEKRTRLGIKEEFTTNENVVKLHEFDPKRRVS